MRTHSAHPHSSGPIQIISGVVVSDPEIHHGEPVFAHTKVPVQALLDYRNGQSPLYEFMLDFPEVQRTQVKAFLELWAEQEKAGQRNPKVWLHALLEEKRAAARKKEDSK